MKTELIESAKLVKEIDDATVAQVLAWRAKDVLPHLALISVGPKKESVFIKLKKKRAKSLGIIFSVYHLGANATLAEITEVINFLNQDEDIHGIILQLPLPKQFTQEQAQKLAQKIHPQKDVDGFNYAKHHHFKPTTAEAIIKLCAEYKIELSNATVIGKGLLVGLPLQNLLKEQNKKVQLTDKSDPKMNSKIFKAKVIISGTNAINPFLNDSFVQEGAVVVAAGNEIDHNKLTNYVRAMTPQKGGVGPLTISLLMRNVVKAVK